MPVYEYWCNKCKARVEIILPRYDDAVPCCPECHSDSLRRLFSTFMVKKTYKDVYDSILSDSQLTRGLMNNDPRALAQWNKQMSDGEPTAPEYQETMERMERGEMPSAPTATESATD